MDQPQPVGVFVCEDQTTVRVGISHILEQAGMKVVGAVGSIDECLPHACRDDVDVYVIGLTVGDARSMAGVKMVLEANPDARIVVFGSYETTTVISTAYEAGARGYVNTSSPEEALVTAVHTVATKDRPFFPPGLAEALAVLYTSGARNLDPRSMLTERELTIFVSLAEGMTHGQISAALGVTEKSIANRAGSIRTKLNIPRGQFTALAIRHGLIDSDQSRLTISDVG